MSANDWRQTSWGRVVTLRYGKALRGYGRSPDRARVYGTNGPVGYTSKPLVDGPGVIVGRKGAYRGIHYAAGDFWVIDTAFYLEAKIELDMLWAYYALQLADINGLDSGSAIPSTTREAFAGLPVLLPSPPEQRAIAEVLSALDDKIAANTALARVATQLASSEFNRVVRGVDPGPTFDQIATVSGGGTPSTTNPDFWDGSVSWATPTDMTALAGPYLSATSRSISKAGLTACSSKLFEPGAVLMTSRATIGAIAVNTVPTAVNQGFIVVEPHDDRLRWWLFHEMESRVEEFISWANGATFLELSRGNFKRLPVRVPADDVVDSFAARASALHDRARAALDENRTLAATRDALLPQLMSGKLRVRDAKVIATDAGA